MCVHVVMILTKEQIIIIIALQRKQTLHNR